MAFFCLLVAVMEWTPTGTASLKGFPWVIRAASRSGMLWFVPYPILVLGWLWVGWIDGWMGG